MVLRHIPGIGEPWVDDREAVIESSVHQIREHLDPVGDTEEPLGVHPCKIPDRVLEKWGRLFDIVLPSGRRTCCFTRGEFYSYSFNEFGLTCCIERIYADGRKSRLHYTDEREIRCEPALTFFRGFYLVNAVDDSYFQHLSGFTVLFCARKLRRYSSGEW